ncbi:MAG: hypothetical protein EAZ07_02455 [Cytophagales bacterium]|nr:MAG: hypothetical protein EAZ07_02455 [Cytophagales bacterium]
MIRKLLFIGLVLSLQLSCKKKPEEKLEPTQDTSVPIDDFVKKAPEPVQANLRDSSTVGDAIIEKTTGYICTTRKIAKSTGYNEQIIMNPQTDVIFPGSLIDGNSVVSGSYTPINIARAPLTISTNMDNLIGEKSTQVANPTLSGVREGISKLLNKGQDGNTAACMSFEYIEVNHSSKIELR